MKKILSKEIKMVFAIARKKDGYFNDGGPQVAFIGKSNVGKSSFINAFTNRRALARSSKTPGCTRQINFFNVADYFTIVDLPGYGYAKRSAKEQKIWQSIILEYLEKSALLKIAIVLIDSRRGPNENDWLVIDMLENFNVKFAVIFTKSAAAKLEEKSKSIVEFKKYIDNYTNIITKEPLFTDSKKNYGIEDFRNLIAENLGFNQ